jgi:hypothetical protein
MGEVVEDSKTGAKIINCGDGIFLVFRDVGVDGNIANDLEYCCVLEC